MRKLAPLVLLVLLLQACSSTTEKSSTDKQEVTSEEEQSGDTRMIDPSEITSALESDDAAKAFELLTSDSFDNKLTISDDLIFWYIERPQITSWFVSKSKIQNGPDYFYLTRLVLKDLTPEVSGNELLIYAGHTPYTFVDAFAFPESEVLAKKILETAFNGSRPDEVTTIEPDPEGPNFGITDEFDIKKDDYNILSPKGYSAINPSLLSDEKKPYNIASYFKFYSEDLDEAERILATDWQGDEVYDDYEDRLDTLDIKGGYMRVITPVQDGFLYTEYVYWNLSDGKKLFAANKVGMEPFTGEVSTRFCEFRLFDKDKWEKAEIGPLQELIEGKRPLYNDDLLDSELIQSAFTIDYDATHETNHSFKLKLPQKGKDIKLTLNHMEGAEVTSAKQVTLTFANGQFVYAPR